MKQDMFDTASDDIKTPDNDNEGSRLNSDEDDFMFSTTNDLYKSDFNDDFMLDKLNESDDENGEEALREAAKVFLGEEAQENIDMAINEANNTEVLEATELWHQFFFRPGSKVFRFTDQFDDILLMRSLTVEYQTT